MKKLIPLLAILILGSTPAFPKATPDAEPIRSGPVALRSDRGYILFRTNGFKQGIGDILPVFLRKPELSELAAYRNAKKSAYEKYKSGGSKNSASYEKFEFSYTDTLNLFSVNGGASIDKREKEKTFLLEVKPGDYVLYGISWGGRIFMSCNCLGTVGFHVATEKITDVGTVLYDKEEFKSDIPELASVTGVSKFHMVRQIAQAVRPETAEMDVPSAIVAIPREAAAFYAVAPFVENGASSITRLAPMPGVLAYDGGDVIDVHSGKVIR